MQFSFVLMHILNNSWCHWECTDILQCLSCKIYGKSCCRERDDTFVLVFFQCLCIFYRTLRHYINTVLLLLFFSLSQI